MTDIGPEDLLDGPDPRPITRADIEKAFAFIEAANVPPLKCWKCGDGFYVVNPRLGPDREEGGQLVRRYIVPKFCEECDPK